MAEYDVSFRTPAAGLLSVEELQASHARVKANSNPPVLNATNRYSLDSLPLELAAGPDVSLDDLVSAVSKYSGSGLIRRLLNNHGAILFKGLGLKNAEEFSRFAQAFGWSPHEEIGNPVRRTVLAYNVATANEGPNTQPVFPHNEFALSPHYPAYVLFYALEAPETGGETPLNSSIKLYERLEKEVPEFIKAIEEKGVQYQFFFPNRPREDISSPGTNLLQSYGKNVLNSDDTETARQKIETEIRRLPTATWQWENQTFENPLGDLRVRQKLPAIRPHEQIGKKAFFNNVISRYLNAKKANTLDPPYLNADGLYQPPALYADGSAIPHEYLEKAVQIVKQVIPTRSKQDPSSHGLQAMSFLSIIMPFSMEGNHGLEIANCSQACGTNPPWPVSIAKSTFSSQWTDIASYADDRILKSHITDMSADWAHYFSSKESCWPNEANKLPKDDRVQIACCAAVQSTTETQSKANALGSSLKTYVQDQYMAWTSAPPMHLPTLKVITLSSSLSVQPSKC